MTEYAQIVFKLLDGSLVTVGDLRRNPDIVLEHEQLEQLFRHQCVRCSTLSRVVHEMVPRGKAGKKWYHWSNRVVLCPVCHDWAHDIGTANSRTQLIQLRDRRIEELYGPQPTEPDIDH